MEECFFIQLSAHTMVPWQCCRNSAHQGTLSRLGTPIPKMLPQKWGLFSHHPGARVLITGLLICNGCPYLHFLLAYFVIAISMGIPLASSRLEYFSLRSYALRRLPLNLLPSAVKGVCFKTSLLHPLRPDSRGCSSEVSANAPRAPATASRPQDGAGRGGSVRNDFR